MTYMFKIYINIFKFPLIFGLSLKKNIGDKIVFDH
jgi:hypothetical protein